MTTWLALNSLGLAAGSVVLYLLLRQLGYILRRVGPSGAPGTPTAFGGVRVPVCWVHVPDPLGFSSHNSPALSRRKLPVTGSFTSVPL